MIRKFFAALGCAVLGAAVMLLALPRERVPYGPGLLSGISEEPDA